MQLQKDDRSLFLSIIRRFANYKKRHLKPADILTHLFAAVAFICK
jgi:hypothetical protein